ncbi:MAG: NAD(P)H-hydrate dehydratase [Lachnospiraceae bacterium]|nr:NAD(P)H-hydrate dehydratase [Lachnospiraceae bacterium]
MKYLVNGKEMKMLDQNTSQHYHVPELVLMEQAAMTFVQELLKLNITLTNGLIVCGFGNNGADGLAIARLLQERGVSVKVCMAYDLKDIKGKCSPSFEVQKQIYETYEYPKIVDLKQIKEESNTFDFVIDAIFGTGLSRNLSEVYQMLVATINQIEAVKIAVDMPSGIHSDNGQVLGNAIKCDYTITFSFEKLGQYLWPGTEYAGRVILAPIGITHRSWLNDSPKFAYLEWNDIFSLPKRKSHSNKGTYGKLLVIAGTKNMAGAAILSAKAAYRNGVGLVKLFTVEENRTILQTVVPEVILSTYGWVLDTMQLEDALKWADAVVLGPGIGTDGLSEKIVKQVLETATVPMVIDADALNIIAQDTKQYLSLVKKPHNIIITPHLGEMSRLTQKPIVEIQEDLIETALDFAKKYKVTCVLKDFHTVIVNPHNLHFLNLSGNNGMATAGSGDVLAGMIGAFLAQGMYIAESATYGVFLHGLAGDMARKSCGTHSMCAQDIIDGLKEIWNKVDSDGNQ